MNEFPVFIPHGNEHLAAVLTVPPTEPRGLVLLLTGIGAPRSHRYQMWTRTARSLAEVGLASARVDYLGMGDSTGTLRSWSRDSPPVDQALTVVRFSQQALGVRRVAAVGNCGGSLAALGVAAAIPECVGAALILMPVFEPTRAKKALLVAGRSRAMRRLRQSAVARRVLVRPLSRLGRKPSSGLQESLSRALGHGRLLLLYGRDDDFDDRAEAQLNRLVARLPSEARRGFELRVLPHDRLSGFDSLATQRGVTDAVVGWLGGLFDRAQGAAERPVQAVGLPGAAPGLPGAARA